MNRDHVPATRSVLRIFIPPEKPRPMALHAIIASGKLRGYNEAHGYTCRVPPYPPEDGDETSLFVIRKLNFRH